MSSTHEITDFARSVARGAGAIARVGFRSADLEVSAKSSIHDVVTQLDVACENFICQEILSLYPTSSIVGEEGGTRSGEGELTWYIDPIDGTSNFARGIAMWAVSIGVARHGEMISGVIFDPVADELFWADDRGAFLDSAANGSFPIRSEGAQSPGQATVAMNFPLPRDLKHYPELALEQFSQVTQEFAQVRMLGSTCITLCWIAAGWLDATVSFETNPWDVAAGSFIVRQAGGTYMGFRDVASQPEARDYLEPHYFAAVEGGRYDSLLDIMRTQSARPFVATSHTTA